MEEHGDYREKQSISQVRAVREWAARTLQVPEDFIEPLQLERYTPGQKFGTLGLEQSMRSLRDVAQMPWHPLRKAH